MKVLAFACLAVLGYCASIPRKAVFSRQDPDSLPLLHLDYATYQAALYDDQQDIYTFTNIRYAAPPTGELRWKKPAPPHFMPGVQDGSQGSDCYQSVETATGPEGSEDCLFLDVYAPGAAVRDPLLHNLPVVVFVHGGSNNNGAKDGEPTLLYNGTGPITTSNNGIIFIAINYRLGAFGFLAGKTSEKEGLPNAGLHDQRAAFSWVRKYIKLLGGNPFHVSAWGESAGASDIFHLLIAQGGTLDPLFQHVFVQSPSSIDNVDRDGFSEDCYQTFASLAGCSDGGYDCLRNADSEKLANASITWLANNTNCGGLATDGTFVRQGANIEFATGNYWQRLESIVVTHVSDEPILFLPRPQITTDDEFTTFVTARYPPYAVGSGVIDAILAFYPSPSAEDSPYKNETTRLAAWIQDFFFTVRVESLVEAYSDRVWAGQYSVPSSLGDKTLHSSDLIPLFWNKYQTSLNLSTITKFNFYVPENIVDLSTAYQSYMISHAVTGDPNQLSIRYLNNYPAVTWHKPSILTQDGRQTDVLNFAPKGSHITTDPDLVKSHAEFVLSVDVALTNLGGYAVPGTVLSSPIADCEGENCETRNYVNDCTECMEF